MASPFSADGNGKAPVGFPPEPMATQVRADVSQAVAGYANFCRVTGTPEEVILDFGLNDQPAGGRDQTIPIRQRIVVNFFTAKRMLAALNMTVQRHEKAFGTLETDIRRRIVGGEP